MIHLVVGPVGAGKSTHARALCREHHAIRLTLDEWMTNLFRPDRPETGIIEWYVARAQRCVDQIWRITEDLLAHGTDVVLEIGLIQRSEREQLYARVDAAAHELVIHVIDAPRDVRRARVMRRNEERGETFAMEVPLPFFELASDRWQPLDEAECAGRIVHFTTTA